MQVQVIVLLAVSAAATVYAAPAGGKVPKQSPGGFMNGLSDALASDGTPFTKLASTLDRNRKMGNFITPGTSHIAYTPLRAVPQAGTSAQHPDSQYTPGQSYSTRPDFEQNASYKGVPSNTYIPYGRQSVYAKPSANSHPAVAQEKQD
jgi:hypothetical protein